MGFWSNSCIHKLNRIISLTPATTNLNSTYSIHRLIEELELSDEYTKSPTEEPTEQPTPLPTQQPSQYPTNSLVYIYIYFCKCLNYL